MSAEAKLFLWLHVMYSQLTQRKLDRQVGDPPRETRTPSKVSKMARPNIWDGAKKNTKSVKIKFKESK